jgi:lysophospholipase L1-like esterase
MNHSVDEQSKTPLSKNATRIELEIEGRLSTGHSAVKTVHDEIYKLRQLDSNHGKVNQRAYHADLEAIDKTLHRHGFLPQMHIVGHGHNAGHLVNEQPGNNAHKRAANVQEGHIGRAERKPAPRAPERRSTLVPAAIRPAAEEMPPALIEAPETRSSLPKPEQLAPALARTDTRLEPAPVASDQSAANYDQLKSAIQRAKAGGRPVSVLQYGDSHIADGHEAQEIKDDLAALAPDQYSTKAKVGTSADYPLRDPKTWLDKPITQAKPDLIIVSYGSNDVDMAWAGDSRKVTGPRDHSKSAEESYKDSYDTLVNNIKQRAPNATLLLVGPTDRYTPKNLSLDTVIQVQKEVAAKYGADYLDIRQEMGGAGSIDALKAKGLAEPDRWHLTAPGYQLVGDIISRHIQKQL